MVRFVAALALLATGCEPDLPSHSSPERSDEGPARRQMCGLDYQWLPADAVGKLVSITESHDEGSVAWAQSLGLLSGLYRASWYSTQAHTFRYHTQDKGQLVEATAAVIAPVPVNETEFPVITFLHGTSGLSDACSITSDWFQGREHPNFRYGAIGSVLASYGYIVVMPDYIGLKASGEPSPNLHPYLVGESQAISSLDAIRTVPEALRAVGSKAQVGPIALWGASQGGHAGAFALSLASQYAPDIDLQAAVLAVPPLNLSAHWHKGMEELGRPTENVLMAFTAMSDYFGLPLNAVVREPLASNLLSLARFSCELETLVEDSLEEMFTSDILAALSKPALGGDPQWNCILRANSPMTADMPMSHVPTLVVYAENDSLVTTDLERPAFASMCERGARLSYLVCAGLEHEEAALATIDETLDFIDYAIANGDSPLEPCEIRAPQACE